MAKKWMKAAFANSHGQFKAKAEHAGKSTVEYAKEHAHDSGKLGKQARLALVGIKSSHKKKPTQGKDLRKKMYGKGSD